MRKRLTVLSVLSAGIILAVGWAVLLVLLHQYLIRSADDSALQSAAAIAEQINEGSLEPELLTTEEISTTAQVVRGSTVISATSNAVGDPPFVMRPQEPGESATFALEELPYDGDGPFRVGALGVAGPDGPPVTVYVAVDVEDAYDELVIAARVSGLTALVILSVLGALLWWALGAALLPVSSIIGRAGNISGKGLHLRVPVPESDDEISALAMTINAMLERIEDSVRQQDSFVADAAHELRTPLATLRARLEVELRRPDEADSDLLGALLAEVVRMTELVDQLLLLSRSDALGQAEFEPVDIDDLVVRAASEFAHPGVELTVHQATPVQIRGRLTLLEQILPNLLANAARYAERRIDLRVRTVDESVVITVDDDGPGIPPADRERVFERFLRLDDSRERSTGGYGLGLAIVAQIVRMHGGTVSVEESALGGARLRIVFPMEHGVAPG